MKKMVSIAVLLIVASLLVFSCKSTGKVNDSTFKRIYDRYFTHLILDDAQRHTVTSGDTLVRIANQYYGNGFYYPVIMLASRDVVLDPDKIQPGMVLTVPNLEKNLSDPNAKASVKGVILDCANIEEDRDRADTARGMRNLSNSL